MPIILVLMLTAACAPVPWPEPMLPRPLAAALAAAAFVAPVLSAGALSRWAATRVKADPYHRPEIAGRYARWRRRLGWANLLLAVFTVVGLGWGWAVWHRATLTLGDRTFLFPLAELLVPAPYLVGLFAAWLLHYDAEKALHDASPDGVRSFWPRGGHFLFQVRPFALLVLFPVGMVATQQSLARLFPAAAAHWLAECAAVLVVPALFVLLPLAVKPALGLTRLPPGPVRDRLEALARGHGFRYTDLLLWHTRGGVANAMVVGAVRQARYVVFTDKLLESLEPDELDAVFGHEVGHVKHGHIPYYAGFFLLSAVATAAGAAVLVNHLAAAGLIDRRAWEAWLALPPLAVLAGYLFVVFGFLSRRCERQADLYGGRVAGGGELTPTGLRAMVRALERVAALNGMDSARPVGRTGRWRALLKAWQHGSIPERVSYLLDVADDPRRAAAFQRRVFAVRCVLFAALAAVAVALGHAAGWADREVPREAVVDQPISPS